MVPTEIVVATSAMWAEISAIAPIILELAVVIGVIALLDWLWIFIEPYARIIIDRIAECVVRIKHAEELTSINLIPR